MGLNRFTPLLGAVALAGCDKLFDLDRLPSASIPGDGANGDGIVEGDAGPIDAGPCVPIGHDEDGDIIDDACDGCPTIASNLDDTDLDGLPDACDRNDWPEGDRIMFWTTFATATELTHFTSVASVTYTDLGNGVATLNNSGSMVTQNAYLPTRVELHVGGLGGDGLAAELAVGLANGAACRVKGAACNGATGGTCVATDPGSAMGSLAESNTQMRRISLFGTQQLTCQITSASNATTAVILANTSFPSGMISLLTSASGSAKLEAVVIYGPL